MWQTRGHDGVVDLLKTGLAQGRTSHAYLFTGPEHTGKSTLARELAMALNCATWQGEPEGSMFAAMEPAQGDVEPGPCYDCGPCRKALAGTHPDLQIFEDWSTESSSVIQKVRGIQYAAGLHPYEGRWKVYLLVDAGELTLPAQNALLKTLEEPASTVCLILTAASPQALLPTVVSRCQHLPLRAPSNEAISGALQELRAVPPEEAEPLAGLAAGRIGWALQAAADPTLLDGRRSAIDQLGSILSSGTGDRFRAAEGLAALALDELDGVLELWLSWFRDSLLLAEGLEPRVINRDNLEALRTAGLNSSEARDAIVAVQRARSHVNSSVNTRMALEVLLMRLPRVGQRVGSAA